MATDFNLDIGVNLVDASLREIASQVRRTFENINPIIDPTIDAGKIKKSIDTLISQPRVLSIIGDLDVIALRKLANKALSNLTPIVGKADKAGLTALQTQIQRAIEGAAGKALQNSAKQIQAAATAGSIGSKTSRDSSSVENSDEVIRKRVIKELTRRADIEGRASRLLIEEEKIRRRVVSTLENRAKAEQAATDVILRNAAKRNKETGGSRDEDANRRITKELAKREAAIRGTTLATEEQLRQAGVMSALLRREIIAEQKKLISAEKDERGAINVALKKEIDIINKQIAAESKASAFVRKGADLHKDLNAVLKGRIDEAKRGNVLTRRSLESKSPGGGRGGANTVTFRGAGDITKFGRTLNPEQLSRFTKALLGAAKAGETASSAFDRFSRSTKRTSGLTSVLEAKITTGTRAAFEFGRQIQFAAQRLAAWATPAAFLFRAVGLLQDSVSTIIELDQQSARLEFFREGGIITQIQKGTIELSDSIKIATSNIAIFTEVAKQTGAQSRDVAEAFVTLGRIGIDVFEGAASSAEKTQAALNSQLVRTVNTLVRLEQGALSSEKAVRSLVAIQRQFQGALNIDGENNAIANIGAQLADVAAKTSFNVAELAETATRVGASFAQIAETNVASTLELIGVAAKATGASSSRTATVFRQFVVKAQQSEVALKAFGIEIREADKASENFGRVTLPKLLSALTQFNKVSATSPAQAEKLVKLLADRRTIADFKALAGAIGDNATEITKLVGGQSEVAKVGKQVERLFLQEQVAADSLTGRINVLRESFDEFIQTAQTGQGLRLLIGGAQNLVGILQAVAEGAKEAKTVLAGIAGVAIAKIVPQIAAATAGAFTGTFNAIFKGGVREEVNKLLSSVKGRIDGINLSEKEGLITARQATSLRDRQLVNIQAQAVAQAELDELVAIEVIEGKKIVIDQERILLLKREQRNVSAEITALQAQGNKIQRDTSNAQSLNVNKLKSSILPILGGVALAGATFFGDTIGEAIGGQDTVIAKGVESALQGAAIAGIIGAQVGSAIGAAGGPIGVGIGALAGVIIGGIGGAISGVNSEEEKIAKDRKTRAEALKARLVAEGQQRKLINAREKAATLAAKDKSEFEKRIVEDIFKIEKLANKVKKAEQGSKEQLQLQSELIERQIGLEALRSRAADEALRVEARKILLARELLDIRIKEQQETERLNLLQEISITNLSRTGAIKIAIEFDKRVAKNNLKTILAEISAQKAELQNVDIQTDRGAREGIERRITELRARELRLRTRVARDNIKKRKELLEAETTEAKKQIEAFKKSSDGVSSSISAVVDKQQGLARLIRQEGEVAAQTIASSAQQVMQILSAQGLGAESKLRFIESAIARQLQQLRRSADVARDALRGGQLKSFSSASEINSVVQNLLDTINDAASRAGDKEFTNKNKTFDLELSFLRDKERQERRLFDLRVQQTRSEIESRRSLLSSEIKLLNDKVRAEADFQRSRADGQKKFGEILLEGPEAFKAAIDNINQARSFFSGISSLNERSITQIFTRARSAIVSGQTKQLNEVVAGIKTQIETGGINIVSRVDNEKLLDVLLRALDPRLTAKELGRQIKGEEALAGESTSVQEEIRKKQEELRQLARTDISLQREQIRIAILDKDTALNQRQTIIGLIDSSQKAQATASAALLNAIAKARPLAGAGFGAGGAGGLGALGAGGNGGGLLTGIAGLLGNNRGRGVGGAGGLGAGNTKLEKNNTSIRNALGPSITDGILGLLNEGLDDFVARRVGTRGGERRRGTPARSPLEILGAQTTSKPINVNGILSLAAEFKGNTKASIEIKDSIENLKNEISSGARETLRLDQNGGQGNEISEQRIALAAEIGGLLSEVAEEKKRVRSIIGEQEGIRSQLNKQADNVRQLVRFAESEVSQSEIRSGIFSKAIRRGKLLAAFENSQVTAAKKSRDEQEGIFKSQKLVVREIKKELVRRKRTELLAQRDVDKNPLFIDGKREREFRDSRLAVAQREIAATNLKLEDANQQLTITKNELDARQILVNKEIADKLKIQSRLQDAINKGKKEEIRLSNARILAVRAREAATLLGGSIDGTRTSNRLTSSLTGVRSFSQGTDFAQFTRESARFGRSGRFDVRSREQIEQANTIAGFEQRSGRGASAGEQRRLSELQRRDKARFSGQNSSQAARTLLGDPTTFEAFSRSISSAISQGNFASDIKSIAGFAAGAKDTIRAEDRNSFRVTGRRAREVDTDATRELLGGIGLSGLASQISNRGDAVKALNLVFKLIESLGKNTKRSREESKKLLEKLVTAELDRGKKEAKDRSRGKKIREGAILEKDRGRADGEPIPSKDGKGKTSSALADRIDEASENFTSAISVVFDRKIQEIKAIRIAGDADVKFSISLDVNNAGGAIDLAAAIRKELQDSGTVLPEAVINILIKQVCENAEALAERGIIRPSLIKEICGDKGRGGR